MSQLRKILRTGKTLNDINTWAERSYDFKYGERAVAIASLCRQQGLRDLVIPIKDVAECIPRIASRVTIHSPCQHGGMYTRAGTMTKRCSAKADILLITDSGLELTLCEEHAEAHVVRLPA